MRQQHPLTILLLTILPNTAFSLPQATTSSPNISALPPCAQSAALSAISASGCGITDVACICRSTPYMDTLRAYIAQNCSTADSAAALAFGQATCAGAGVALTSSSADATKTMTTVVQGTVTSTISVATMSSALVFTTLDSQPGMNATATTNCDYNTMPMTTATRTGMTTAPAPPAATTYTGGAGKTMVGMAMAVVGVAGWMVFL